MGNKPVKQEKKEELLLKIVPPLDRAYTCWLARDLERIYGFTPRNPRAIKPPDSYIEYMRLNGLLDLDLDDPDLAHLFKEHETRCKRCTYRVDHPQEPEILPNNKNYQTM